MDGRAAAENAVVGIRVGPVVFMDAQAGQCLAAFLAQGIRRNRLRHALRSPTCPHSNSLEPNTAPPRGSGRPDECVFARPH